MAGRGCKRAPAWHTDLTREEIDKKIKEFWETRVDGNQKIWAVLRQACEEPDWRRAEHFTKSIGLTLINGLLLHSIDDRGHRYDVPAFVINPAEKYAESKKPENSNEIVMENRDIPVKIRCLGFQDSEIVAKSGETVESVKKTFKEMNKVEKNVRLFFNGKEMKDDWTMAKYPIKDGVVLQVFTVE
jgi:hypothetical protein